MAIPLVNLKAQYAAIKSEVDAAIAQVLADTAFIQGKYAKTFEEAFAAWCGVKHCLGVGNGTDALFITLKALGVGPGDEVICPANSFVATSEAIGNTGAKVVFCDVDPVTYTLNPALAAQAVTPRTKVLLPVHLYGQPADMKPLLALAAQHDLAVVEDAAQAHGAFYGDQKVGTLGRAACFSFYPGKNLGAYGDAGAIVTNDDELARWARMYANHGRLDKYDHAFEGVNSRLDGLQGAVLGVKLKHLDDWNARRRQAAAWYDELLAGGPMVTPVVAPGVTPVFHLYVVRVGNREECLAHLKANGVDAGVHYPVALPNLMAYRHLGHTPGDFPVATRLSGEILSLPIFPEITREEVAQVCAELRKVAKAPAGTAP